jgi:probable phosphoglycerate mutase
LINIKWYDNTSVSIIDYEDGKFDVVAEGDISHLGKELCTVLNQEWWNEYNEKYQQRNKNQVYGNIRTNQ